MRIFSVYGLWVRWFTDVKPGGKKGDLNQSLSMFLYLNVDYGKFKTENISIFVIE